MKQSFDMPSDNEIIRVNPRESCPAEPNEYEWVLLRATVQGVSGEEQELEELELASGLMAF